MSRPRDLMTNVDTTMRLAALRAERGLTQRPCEDTGLTRLECYRRILAPPPTWWDVFRRLPRERGRG